jgi:hypothetical protein
VTLSSARVETSPLVKAGERTTSRSQRKLVSMPSTRLAPAHLHRDHRFRAGGRVHDQLGQHRIVPGADRAARHDPGFGADIGWELQRRQRARGGAIIERRVFGIEAHLHRMALRLRRFAIEEGEIARPAAHHPFDQIDAHHLFGDAVFDLQSGVHLKEEEFLRSAS